MVLWVPVSWGEEAAAACFRQHTMTMAAGLTSLCRRRFFCFRFCFSADLLLLSKNYVTHAWNEHFLNDFLFLLRFHSAHVRKISFFSSSLPVHFNLLNWKIVYFSPSTICAVSRERERENKRKKKAKILHIEFVAGTWIEIHNFKSRLLDLLRYQYDYNHGIRRPPRCGVDEFKCQPLVLNVFPFNIAHCYVKNLLRFVLQIQIYRTSLFRTVPGSEKRNCKRLHSHRRHISI